MSTELASSATPGAAGRLIAFLRDVRAEIRKVTWPTWPELRKATGVIILFVAALGLAIGWMDWVFQLVFVRLVAQLF